MKQEITSIILAGGKSSRMGQNKAMIKYKGITLIQHVYNAVSPFSNQVLISSNIFLEGFHETTIIPDELENAGPVGGIYSCLKKSKTELNIITTCDTPLLTQQFFQYLIHESKYYQVSNPEHNGINEPVIGVFSKSILPAIESFIRKKIYSPPKIIQSVKSQLIRIDSSMPFYHPLMFESINTPENLKKLQSIK